jgi:hypothetical protein
MLLDMTRSRRMGLVFGALAFALCERGARAQTHPPSAVDFDAEPARAVLAGSDGRIDGEWERWMGIQPIDGAGNRGPKLELSVLREGRTDWDDGRFTRWSRHARLFARKQPAQTALLLAAPLVLVVGTLFLIVRRRRRAKPASSS